MNKLLKLTLRWEYEVQFLIYKSDLNALTTYLAFESPKQLHSQWLRRQSPKHQILSFLSMISVIPGGSAMAASDGRSNSQHQLLGRR